MLLNNFLLAPGVALQQMMVNLSGYVQDFLNDPTSSTVATINQQIQNHLAGVLTGYGLQDANSDTTTTVVQHTLDGNPASLGGSGHAQLFALLPGFLPADQAPTLTPILEFLASPASGILIGALGPFLSPWVALMNSVSDGDDFTQTVVNMVGAFFNGADINLNSLIPAIEQSGFLPAGMNFGHLDFALGGLLSPGSVSVGPYQVTDAAGDIVSIPAVGGSIFNNVGLQISGVPVVGTLDVPSQPIGPIGAWEGWTQIIGALLGSGWSGLGPVDVAAPGLGIDLPTIPDDVFGDGGDGGAGTGVADAFGWLQDLLSGLGL